MQEIDYSMILASDNRKPITQVFLLQKCFLWVLQRCTLPLREDKYCPSILLFELSILIFPPLAFQKGLHYCQDTRSLCCLGERHWFILNTRSSSNKEVLICEMKPWSASTWSVNLWTTLSTNPVCTNSNCHSAYINMKFIKP